MNTTIVLLLACACMLGPGTASAERLKLAVPVSQLESAVLADSNNATAHYNLAIGYWSKGRWDDAQRALDATLEIEPRHGLAYLARAYLPFARQPKLWKHIDEKDVPTAVLPQLQQIERDYQRAFFFNPLVDLRIIGAVTPPRSFLWQSDAYLSALYDTWIRAFDDLLTADYASAYRRFGNMAEAYNSTGRSSLSRIPADLLWYQGLTAAQLGLYDEAIANVTEVLRRADSTATKAARDKEQLIFNPLGANDYRYALGVLLARAGRGEDARRVLREVVAQDMGRYMAHVIAASTLERDNRWQEAAVERRAAVAANPEDASSTIELAVTLSKTGAVAETEQLLDEVARTHPRNARAYYLLGLLKQQLGKADEAKAAFTHFLGIAPSHAAREIADAQRRVEAL